MSQPNKLFIEKLYKALPELVEKGIISVENANNIKLHYGPPTKTEKENMTLIIFGILGTILVSSGIILLLAHNWANLSRAARTLIAFTPLVLSIVINMWGFLKERVETTSWKESVSLFWMASIGIAIALISQTYHIPGSFERFLMVWMLLSLPILYIHRSATTLIGYFLGSTIWVMVTSFSVPGRYVFGYIPLIGAALPIIFGIFRNKFYSTKSYILTWTLLPLFVAGFSCTFDFPYYGIWIPLFGLLFSLIYMLKKFYPKEKGILKRPLNTLGGVAIWVMAVPLSFKDFWTFFSFGKVKSTGASYMLPNITYAQFDYAILALLTCGTAFLIYASIKGADSKEDAVFGSFGIICLIAWLAITSSPVTLAVIFVLFNVFVFGVGIFRVIKGVVNLDQLKLNTGLVMISSIIFLRFFDADLSLSGRGIIFILIGLGFWFANHQIVKRKRETNV